MRFMMLVRSNGQIETGALPTEGELARMAEYNEQLANAGMLRAAEGLQASSKSARVEFSGGKPTVVQGPFPASELIAGFWMIEAKDQQEAIDWAKRVPFEDGEIEIRQVFEAADFGEELTPELRQREERLRDQIGEPH